MESCPPSSSRSAGNNGHGLRGDNARRSGAAWVAGHVHHRLGHPGPRSPGAVGKRVAGGGGGTKLGESPPPGPAPTHPGFWGRARPGLCRQHRRGHRRGSTGRYRAAQVPGPPLALVSLFLHPPPTPPPHPSHPHPPAGLPPSPSPPHYFCYHKAASVPKRRHVRGKQSAIVRSLGTRGGGAEGARGPPPAAPRPGRSDAIVMEIAFPHAVELDVDSFSLGLHVSPATCLWENFLSGSSVKLINQGLEMAMGHKRGQPGETPANSQKPPGVYSPGLPGRRCPARRPR